MRLTTLSRTFAIALALATTACSDRPKDHVMPDLADVRAKLAFTCAYERDVLPPLPAEADVLFKYARWQQKNNILKEDPTIDQQVGRLYRIAAAHGHYKAIVNLQNGIARHRFAGDIDEIFAMTQGLIERGIPGGYYDMGIYLEKGINGVKQDPDLALKYFRKAADLGSPEGQYYVGDKLTDLRDVPSAQDIGIQMWRCAAEQGHGEAALALGIHLTNGGLYREAIQALQLGVKAGNEVAALGLDEGFNGPASTDRLYFLGQEKDPERAARYKAIGKTLSDYSYLNPKVPEIDQIVPLPPAKLPPWDGKIQWLKDHEANIPPTQPSEELIARLAREKSLDPLNGMPLVQKQSTAEPPSAPAAAPKAPLGTRIASGSRCPQSGTWSCDQPTAQGGPRRIYQEGMTFSQVAVPVERGLWEKLTGGPNLVVVDTAWTLEAYPEAKVGA